MKEYILCILCILSLCAVAYGQSDCNNTLKSKGYQEDPKKYVSTLDVGLMKTDVLIDRSCRKSIYIGCNGVGKVTVTKPYHLTSLLDDLQYASEKPKRIKTYNELYDRIDFYDRNVRAMPIGIVAYEYDYIAPDAITNGLVSEKGSHLHVNKQSRDIFAQDKVFMSSLLMQNVAGDEVKFIVSKEFYFTNMRDKKLESVEIDFGNGKGFRKVTFGHPFTVRFPSPRTQYVEIATRLTYYNKEGKKEVYHAHSVFHRTGSEALPQPHSFGNRSVPDAHSFLYPAGCAVYFPARQVNIGGRIIDIPEYWDFSACELAYNILYGSNATDKKLRRPFIVTDGFDPRNRRGYRRNNIPADNELRKNNDERGLYHFVNGDPSPWEEEPSANLVTTLRNEGYDIVFIDYIKGTGWEKGAYDIPTMGGVVRNFLKNVINSDTYRDNKTEEAIVVGPSMGGLITRHALKTMENAGEQHFVKTWVAFDSPMKGASIPMSMQFAVEYFSTMAAFWKLKKLKKSAIDGTKKLSTPAGRQLLVNHFLNSYFNSKPHTDFNAFYRQMDNLGYPRELKRYAISNGGKGLQYPSSSNPKNLDFRVYTGIASARGAYMKNTMGSHWIFRGRKPGSYHDFSTYPHIGYDNAPGGYNTALYSFNCHPGNTNKKPDHKSRWTTNTFMPTCSTLGIVPTTSTVHKTWEWFQANPQGIPFDDFWGMESRNEEHVNISQATAAELTKKLHDDFDKGYQPYRRSGETRHKDVSGKVAYTHKKTATFGGAGNTIAFKSGADVRVRAGQLVKLERGVTIRAGAKVHIATDPSIDYATVYRRPIPPTVAVDPNMTSRTAGLVYDYSQHTVSTAEEGDADHGIALHPIPASDYVTLTTRGEVGERVVVYDILGKQVAEYVWLHDLRIDLSQLSKGAYLIQAVRHDGTSHTLRCVKQ